MRKQISYTEIEPCVDFVTGQPAEPIVARYTVITNNDEEYAARMAAISDPAKAISDIAVEDLPPLPPTLEERQASIEAAIREMAGELYGG